MPFPQARAPTLTPRPNPAAMVPQFTNVVFALNDAPLATPYACETSYFVDVADMLEARGIPMPQPMRFQTPTRPIVFVSKLDFTAIAPKGQYPTLLPTRV